MSTPSKDPSAEHEPHFGGGPFRPDPSESKAASKARRAPDEDAQVEHSVWDEPVLSGDLAGPTPPDALTYARWLESRLATTGALKSWAISVGAAALAGPLALLGTFCGSVTTGARSLVAILALTVFGPLLEEMMKVALPLWIVEKRPFYFRSRLQLLLCVLVAGLVFASIENVVYLYIYVADPTPGLARWRWTVCVAMHMGCSLIAGLGLMRIWARTMADRTRPQLPRGAAYLATAVVVHGAYNAFAVVLDQLDFQF